MIQIFREGGWSMCVIVAFGGVALATAAYHAARPDSSLEGFLSWMTRAVLWAVLAGLAADVGATFHTTQAVLDGDLRTRLAMQGVAESMSPAILGFVCLSIVDLLTAVGRRRLDARGAEGRDSGA